MGNRCYRFHNHTMLSKSETYELIIKWQTEKCFKSRNKIIVHNLRFIAKVVRSLKDLYHYVDTDDLMGYGVEGFIKSLDKFEVSSNEKLITYAVFWIRQSIQRNSEDCEVTIRYPANVRENIRKAVKAGNVSDDKQLIIDNYRGNHRADQTIGDETSSMTIADKYAFVNHNPADLIDGRLIIREQSMKVKDILAELPPREQQTIGHMYGMDGSDAMTLREISSILGVSHEQVRKLRKSAFQHTRKRLNEVYQSQYLPG